MVDFDTRLFGSDNESAAISGGTNVALRPSMWTGGEWVSNDRNAGENEKGGDRDGTGNGSTCGSWGCQGTVLLAGSVDCFGALASGLPPACPLAVRAAAVLRSFFDYE